MYVICLLVVIVLYVSVFTAVQRQRSRRQQRRRNQYALIAQASTCPRTTLTVEPRRSIGNESALGTEMVIMSPKREGDAGGGTDTMIAADNSRQPSVVVQTSKSRTAARVEQNKSPSISQTALLVLQQRDLDKGRPGDVETLKTSTGKGSVIVGQTAMVSELQIPVQGRPGIVQASKSKTRRQSESTFLANLRTASMLFVVTVVFIVTFTPGFLMSLDYLPWNMTVFYLYFANNVANPFIYSFMNHNFRTDLARLVCKKKPPTRRSLTEG